MLVALAFFSCSYDARLFCKAASAASVPAVPASAWVLFRSIMARCVMLLLKWRSAVESDVYSSLRKVSGEILRSIVLVPRRSFY